VFKTPHSETVESSSYAHILFLLRCVPSPRLYSPSVFPPLFPMKFYDQNVFIDRAPHGYFIKQVANSVLKLINSVPVTPNATVGHVRKQVHPSPAFTFHFLNVYLNFCTPISFSVFQMTAFSDCPPTLMLYASIIFFVYAPCPSHFVLLGMSSVINVKRRAQIRAIVFSQHPLAFCLLRSCNLLEIILLNTRIMFLHCCKKQR
jgi:hypothetical protein